MAEADTPEKKVHGSVYLNGNRWWWRVRLPGQRKRSAIALVPGGGKLATKNYETAVEVAEEMWLDAHKRSVNKRNPVVRTISDPVMHTALLDTRTAALTNPQHIQYLPHHSAVDSKDQKCYLSHVSVCRRIQRDHIRPSTGPDPFDFGKSAC